MLRMVARAPFVIPQDSLTRSECLLTEFVLKIIEPPFPVPPSPSSSLTEPASQP